MTQDLKTLLRLTPAGSIIDVPYVNGDQNQNPHPSVNTTRATITLRMRFLTLARATIKSKRDAVASAEKRWAGR